VLRALWATADFFPVLRVMPLIGRPFTIENEVNGSARVAVISYGLWQRRFDGAPDIVGRRLPGILGDFEILGVMPPGFTYPVGEREPTEVWIPFVVPDDERVRGNRYGYNLQVIGRLRDGVSIEQAQAQMDLITAALAAETPRWFTDRVAKVERLHEYVTRSVRTWMLLLLGAVACVMLIACVNLANLMLVRATTRTRELGVRSALGASRWDLCRMLLAESLILSVTAAACGLLVANLGVDVLRSTIPAGVPRVASVAVDVRVLVATAIVAVVTGLIFGMTPLMHYWRERPGSMPYQRERGTTSGVAAQELRSTLVVAEVALAMMLVIGAGLFLGSFARVTSIDLGIDHHDVMLVRVRPPVGPPQWSTGMPVTPPEVARARHPEMLERVLERVRAIPGVQVAALAGGGLPLRGDLITVDFGIPGRELPRNNDIDVNEISPDYFRALHVPLLRGRLFTETDRQGSQPVTILNEAAARRYFGNDAAVGKIVQLRGERTVVGVVGNIRHFGPESDLRTQAFVPFCTIPPGRRDVSAAHDRWSAGNSSGCQSGDLV
jgi:putative ABC transport system permease protein